MSAVLSNIYMLTFDDKVHQFADSIGALYFRYCDDMLLIGPSGTGGAIKQFVDNQIKSVGLELQHEKTDELTFDLLVTGPIAKKPLQYLGFCFDGVRTWIRSSSIARFHQRMRRGVRMLLKGAERRNKRRELAGRAPTPLHLKTVYRRYSYLGRRNFLSYGFRSAAALDEETIKGQLRPLWRKLRRKLN